MDRVHLVFVVRAERFAFRIIGGRVSLQNIAPSSMRLNAGFRSPGMAPSREVTEEVLYR